MTGGIVLIGWMVQAAAAATPSPAIPQAVPPGPRGDADTAPPPDAYPLTTGPDIIVLGRREDDRSAADENTSPREVLDAARIFATGATSISELLRRLRPLTEAAGGKEPVILINRRPLTGAADLMSLPPEAIEQLQILAERDAPKFGAAPDRRVVNLVLRRRFRSAEAQPRAILATDGGGMRREVTGNLVRLVDRQRVSIQGHISDQDELGERQRGIVEEAPRSLIPANRSLMIHGLTALPLGETTTAAIGWSVNRSDGRALRGLAPRPDGTLVPARQRTGNTRYESQLSFSGNPGEWTWNAQASVSRSSGENRVLASVGGLPLQRNTNWSREFGAELRTSGRLAKLPAGPLQLAMFVRYDANVVASGGMAVGPVVGDARQQSGSTSMTLTVPITRRSDDRPSALGDLSATLTGGVARATGAGRAPRLDGVVNWQPIPILDLSVALSVEQDPVPAFLRGAPLLVTPAVPTFDFVRGETVFATVTGGGNPDLRAERRERRQASVNLRPLKENRLSLDISYVEQVARDPVMSIGVPTPLLIAAFPERFVRDGDGRLVAVDTRPTNLFRARQRELNLGVSLFLRLDGPPPGMAAPSPPPAPGRGRARFAEGRTLTLNLRPAWQLEDRLTLRSGGPTLDVLSGDTIMGGSGRPRFTLFGNATYGSQGTVLALGMRSQTPTRVVNAQAAADLRFSALTIFNAALTVPMKRLGSMAWMEKAQLSLDIDNIANRRQAVRDRDGNTPLRFRPGYIDPLGRTIALALRTRF